jgi:hypothetical protein
MISYDDLVVALAAWRARQGLPVVQVAGAVAAPVPASAPVVAPPSMARSAPPRPGPAAAPAEQDFEDSALVEEAPYDAAGDDYVVSLGVEQPGEPTSINGAPEPPTDGAGRRGKRPAW